jgi:hypothetical protein
VAIRNTLSLRGGKADAAIQVVGTKCIFVLLDCFTSFAMTAFGIPVTATRLQLRAKRGRGEADVAIWKTPSLREGEADAAIQMVKQNASLSGWIASLRSQ